MPIALNTEGAHPATHLCLQALQWLQERRDFARVLDMGCGNGILSVAAAAIWDSRVLAADISEQALEDARRNIAANGMEERVTLVRSDGFVAPRIREQAPYDLILFNLLAEPVVAMAQEVKAHLAAGGMAVIGGLLAWKAGGAAQAYQNLGFEIVRQFDDSPWRNYIVRLPEKP